MKSRISWSKSFRAVPCKAKNSTTPPEVVLQEAPKTEETAQESEDPEEVVARAEARAREDQKKAAAKRSSKCVGGSKRQYAESLHRQADILHHRGDYEAALVLYHRASTAYPRDPSHVVAVRRTSAAISSATNPSGIRKKSMPRTKNAGELAANYCPETAALRAKKLVEETSDPISAIDQILKYFDSRKDFWRDPPISQNRRRTTLVSRSKVTLRQLSNMAGSALENLQASFASGDAAACLKIGEELILVAAALPDRYRYQVAARHYLAMTQITLGRHDRAVDQVSSMVRLAGESGDAALRSRSLMTLGRVHLTFRHLDAAARVWERLVTDVEDAVPKAWLLHEIGRCYYEMKRYGRALKSAERCLEYADEANSQKWLMHGNLLSGQSLVEIGRLGEAVRALKIAAEIARETEDASTVEYVTDLIDRVTGLLRRAVFLDEDAESKDQLADRPVDRVCKVKSEDKVRSAKSSERSCVKRRNEAKRFDATAKSKTIASKAFRKNMRSPKFTRTKNARASVGGGAPTRPNDLGIVEDSILTIYPSHGSSGTFDLSVRENDVNPSETSTSRITSIESYRRDTDLSTGRHGDFYEIDNDLLTSRTRVISAKISSKEDTSEKMACLVRKEINDEEVQVSGSDSEKSDGTAVTYVLDELRKCSIIQNNGISKFSEAWDTVDNGDLELCQGGNENTDETMADRVLDNSNSTEYLRDEKMNYTENSSLRACLYDEGIDEEGEEEEDEEDDEEEVYEAVEEEEEEEEEEVYEAVEEDEEEEEEKGDEEEVGSSSLNHREVSSPSESKVSRASTGRTYLVDEGKTMSHISPESRSRYVDRENSMRNERSYRSPIDVSPERNSRVIVDSRIKVDTIETIGDSSRDSITDRRKKTINLTNLSMQRSPAEIREKHTSECPKSSDFFVERRENDTHGIRRILEEHLATSESISTPRRYGFVSSVGQHPLYRHSLPTSPRKKIQPQSL